MTEALTIEQLRDAITEVCGGHAAWGQNLHPSKPVYLRIYGTDKPLVQISVAFIEPGQFALILTGKP